MNRGYLIDNVGFSSLIVGGQTGRTPALLRASFSNRSDSVIEYKTLAIYKQFAVTQSERRSLWSGKIEKTTACKPYRKCKIFADCNAEPFSLCAEPGMPSLDDEKFTMMGQLFCGLNVPKRGALSVPEDTTLIPSFSEHRLVIKPSD